MLTISFMLNIGLRRNKFVYENNILIEVCTFVRFSF